MNNKIAIDMRYVESPYSGLSRFSINIFKNLIKNTNDQELIFVIFLPPIYLTRHLDDFLRICKKNVKFIYSKNKRGLKWKIPFFIFDLSIYKVLKKENVSIFVSPYIDPPYLPGIKVISTIHDLIFLNIDNYFNNFKKIKRFFSELRIIMTLIYSNHLLTVSKTSKELLIRRYKLFPKLKNKLNNITIINNGVNKFKQIKDNSKNKKIFSYKNKYILYVGDRRNHKNLFYTIDLIKNLNQKYKDEYNLLIAGSKSYKNTKLQKYIDKHLFVKEIINPNDNLLDDLYRNCELLILLSKDEGFGIPVIEAASRSKKIVISNISALKEVAPENSLVLDLESTNNHINLLRNYLNKAVEINSQTIFDKWSWDKSSLILKELILSTLSTKSNRK